MLCVARTFLSHEIMAAMIQPIKIFFLSLKKFQNPKTIFSFLHYIRVARRSAIFVWWEWYVVKTIGLTFNIKNIFYFTKQI